MLAQVGETTVLVAATASRGAREGVDFFPLTVDVEERMYAAGKIPGGFFRREGRPTERAILTARLIDRPLRPCFPDGFRNEVHVVATVMTVDQANQPDVVAINGASAALMLSGIPFDGPVGAVRLAHIEGRWVPNPTFQEIENATFEIVVVGRRNEDGGAGILMVEAGATEIALDLVEAGAPEMTEELVAEGLEEAKTWILEAIAHQEELVAQAGRRTPAKTWVIAPPYDSVLSDRVSSNARDRIVALISEADKQTRESGLDELSAEVVAGLEAEFPDRAREIDGVFRKLVKALVRERIVNDGKRIDGRGLRDIRPISCDVGILPRLHGTGLFNRGQTQVLSTVTLGMLRLEQMLDECCEFYRARRGYLILAGSGSGEFWIFLAMGVRFLQQETPSEMAAFLHWSPGTSQPVNIWRLCPTGTALPSIQARSQVSLLLHKRNCWLLRVGITR